MGFTRTILWTILTIVLCFILAWGINHYRLEKKIVDKESPENVAVTPANPGGNWPQFHGNQSQTGYVSGELPDSLEPVWRFKAGEGVKSSPAIVNNIVYIGSSDKHIYAIDIKSGKLIWSRPLDDEIEASPLVIDKTVYIGTLAGTIYALDSETGAERWRFCAGDKLTGGANWFKNTENKLYILAGSYDSVLYCIDALTGKVVFQYETGNYINGSPAVNDKYCVFGGCDAVIHIINLSDGKKAGEIDTGAYIAASAAIKDGYVYIGNYEGEFLKASLSTHETSWRYKIEKGAFISSPAVADDAVVIGGADMNIYCIDIKTGRALWRYTTLDAVNSSPVIVSNRVLAGSDDGRLYMLNMTDGKLIWSYETGRSITSSPAVANGMVVVGCDDGMVYCFK
ncbi:MAG: PQQ-binding-like beta-propeller repeat protein [Deltaproteobacteria bacterium]|nr:PQQ-binding-like beta-propeller repeat protein [Deltaproteobacteria bacterium]